MLSLDAAGRPSYAKPGKPTSVVRSAGRVLKEKENPSVGGKQQTSLPNIRQSISSKGGPSSSSASLGTVPNIEVLQSRIMLLEKENMKLKADNVQSEKAIKNYRSFLSQRQSAPDEVETKTGMTQTEGMGLSDVELALAKSERAREDLVTSNRSRDKEIEKLQSRLQTMELEWGAQKTNDTDLLTLNASEKQARAKVDELRRQVKDQEEVINALHCQLDSQQKDMEKQSEKAHAGRSDAMAFSFQVCLASVANSKKAFRDDMLVVKRALSDFGGFLGEIGNALKTAITRHESTVKAAQMSAMAEVERDSMRRELVESAERFSKESGDMKARMLSAEAKATEAATALAEVERDLEAAKAAQKVEHERYLEAEAMGEAAAARIKEMEALSAEGKKEATVAKMQEQNKDASLKKALLELQMAKDASGVSAEAVESFAERHRKVKELVVTADRLVDGLDGLQKETVAVGKKLAHVKELQKVAAVEGLERELERFAGEVKYLREVNNVYKFGIKLSEQSLEEVQPHVVEKLSQSRARQLKLLAKQRATATQDLESRAKEMANMNGSVMGTFAKKAKEKEEKVTQDVKETLGQLKDLLQQFTNI